MANYSSSGPQVPFGDGSHVPLEETVQGDVGPSEINMQQMAMKDIFLSCDVDNTGLVMVSKLIDFITPFMQQNNTELLELKKALDPHSSNPCVNKETFYKVMSEWTSHIMAAPTERDGSLSSSTQISEWDTTEDKDSLVQSVSRTSFGQYVLKGQTDSSIQNLSTSSSCSYEGSTMSVVDVNTLQEQIQELEYHNRKLSEELTHVRLQLTSCEEQKEVLHADVEKLSRKLVSEQQLNGQLQLKKNDSEEMLEISAVAQKQIGKLEKLLVTAEKENVQLKQNIESMEVEKQKLEDTIKQLTKREDESKKLLLELQSDIDCKEHIIVSLEEANNQLKSKAIEQQQIVTHYSDVNERLKAEKVKLEQCFRERMLRSSLSNQSKSPSSFISDYTGAESSGTFKHPAVLNTRRHSINTCDNTKLPRRPSLSLSPRGRLMRTILDFNSPKLLSNLANPVSPHLNSSPITSSRLCKKSVDSDDSPAFVRCERNVELMNVTSTPEGQKLAQKALLDETLPSVVRKLPLLVPNREAPHEKDLSFFRQYRLVGSGEDDNQYLQHSPSKHLFNMTGQTYDNNLNLIVHTGLAKRDTLPSASIENGNAESSLPTLHVIEHSGADVQNRSPSGSSPRASGLDSSEDEMYWKLQMFNLSSPHDSLEQEIVQAETGCQTNENKQLVTRLKTDIEHLELKNTEYEATIKQLIRDINCIHAQNTKNEKQVNECEEKYKDLLAKFKELEGDNSSKYIKIVDLMEQTEKLQQQLNGDNDDKPAQLNQLKAKISELQQEKDVLQEQLQQWEKQKSETLMQHLQSMKDECELLRRRLDVSTRVEQNITKEFEKICCENAELRKQRERLVETIRELDAEKSKLTSNIKKLSDEYSSIKAEIKAKNAMESETSGKLTKLLNENLELKERFVSGNLTRVESQSEEVENLKQVLKQHTATIEQLSQSAEEKKHQISMLKKMVNYQNENLKALEDSKLKNADQLYEQKCANDNLVEENRALLEKFEHKEEEMNELQCQLIAVGDSNKAIQAELENIRSDNNRMKDTHKILTEHQSLVEEKHLLIRQKEELSEDNSKLEKSNNDLQQQLLELQRAKNDLSAIITELTAKLHSAEMEIAKLAEKLRNTETANDQSTNDLLDEISQLEETSKALRSENETLLCKFKALKASYETLNCEKKEWVAEQSNWEQMKEEFKSNLTSAKNEALHLQQRLNEIEADAMSSSENPADEDVCENCIMFKLEIEELNAHIDQLNSEVVALETEDRNNKRGNFEKMQVKIEKLKTKTEEAEGLLESEKQRVEALKQTNLKLLEQIDDNLKHHKEEKAVIFAEKAVIEIKLNDVIEDLKRAQNEKHELEQEKNYTSRNSVNLEKKLRDASRLMEERLELMNKANSQLQEEVADLRNRKASLEKKLTKLQLDTKMETDVDGNAESQSKTKGELESVNKENVQLQQEVTDLHSQKVILEKQLDKLQNELKEKLDLENKLKAEAKIKEDLVDSINNECVQLQQELQNTHNQKVRLERKLEKTQNDLQKSEAKNLSIRKMLTDMRASVHDECEDMLQRNVEALLKERNSEVDILQKQLKDYEEELADVKLQLNESADSMNMLSEHINGVSKTLAEKRQELCQSVLALIDNWRTLLEDRDTLISNVIEALFNNEATTSAENPTGPLDEEMDKLKYQIQFITQFFDALATIKIPATTTSESEKAAPETTPSLLLGSRFVKKVTLKTTTTEIRPIHSDTWITKATQTDHISANTKGPAKMNDSYISSTQRSFPQRCASEGSLVRVEHEGFGSAALEIASPGLSDSVMESLGLLEEDDSSEAMAMETEEKYGVLAAAFMINISTIKDRYQQQQGQQSDIENQFSTESEKLVSTLSTIRELDREHHLDKHISTCLQQVNSIVGMFARTSVLAMQYGALLHEQRLLKCIGLMINYTAHLKEVIEKAALQLKFIRSTHLNVNPERLPVLVSSNCSAVSSEVADQSGLDCSSPDDTSEADINDDTDRCLLYRLWKYLQFFSHRVIARNEWFWLPIIFILGAVIAVILMNIADFNTAPCSVTYPWEWVSWSDIIAPYIKRTHPNGPPPI